MSLLRRIFYRRFRDPIPEEFRVPILGVTVSQGEYDALKAECDRAHARSGYLQYHLDEVIKNRQEIYGKTIAEITELKALIDAQNGTISKLTEIIAKLEYDRDTWKAKAQHRKLSNPE